MTLRDSILARNAALDAIAPLMNLGWLRYYSGTLPATPETAVNGTLLCSLRLNITAFAAASGGALTANAITSDMNAAATGTAAYFRIFKSDGTTAVMDGDISTSGAAINMNSTAIQAGAQVDCTSLVLTLPM
jgi:hypothetical protein